jgi:hypothetical protein
MDHGRDDKEACARNQAFFGLLFGVAQTSKSAVTRVSKPARGKAGEQVCKPALLTPTEAAWPSCALNAKRHGVRNVSSALALGVKLARSPTLNIVASHPLAFGRDLRYRIIMSATGKTAIGLAGLPPGMLIAESAVVRDWASLVFPVLCVTVLFAMLFFMISWFLHNMDHRRPDLFAGLIASGCVLLALLVCIPNFVHSGTTKLNGIISNLRILDGAKQQWALEHNRTGPVEVTREDVAEYLGVGPYEGWVELVAGEQYALRNLTEMPEAELTRDMEGLPKGTRIRLLADGTNNGTNWRHAEIIPPNKGAETNASAPHR